MYPAHGQSRGQFTQRFYLVHRDMLPTKPLHFRSRYRKSHASLSAKKHNSRLDQIPAFPESHPRMSGHYRSIVPLNDGWRIHQTNLSSSVRGLGGARAWFEHSLTSYTKLYWGYPTFPYFLIAIVRRRNQNGGDDLHGKNVIQCQCERCYGPAAFSVVIANEGCVLSDGHTMELAFLIVAETCSAVQLRFGGQLPRSRVIVKVARSTTWDC